MQEKIIKKIKYEYNLSQQDIADKLGVSKSFISLIETGKKKLPENRLKQLLEICPVTFEETKTAVDADMEQVTELYRKFRNNKDIEAGKLLIEKIQLMIKILDNQNLKP